MNLLAPVITLVVTRYTTTILHPETADPLLRLGDTDVGRNELPMLFKALGYNVRVVDEADQSLPLTTATTRVARHDLPPTRKHS